MMGGAGTLVGIPPSIIHHLALTFVPAARDAHKGPHPTSTPPASLQPVAKSQQKTKSCLCRRRFARLERGGLQRLVKIIDQIIHSLQSHREADEIGRHPRLFLL